MTEERKVQLGVTVDASGARQGFDEVKAGARDMAHAVAQSGQQAGQGVDAIGSGGEASAQKLDRSTRSIIGSVQRATAAMEAGERGTRGYFESLAQQRGASVDALRPYLDQLDAAKAKQEAARASLGTMGMSAKQIAAALRGVPAQMTDIVVSLTSGQRPMTVLLQQGGQLKDMFGGVGAAARAVGGYVLGLVNPFTLAAATAGGLAYAISEGIDESRRLGTALILTGNAAASTVGRLNGIAESVSAMTGATQGAVVDVIEQLVSSGQVAEKSMAHVSTAIVSAMRAAGQPAKELVKDFEDIGKGPVSASEKLNQQYNYLTASLYKQIKALEDQGRTADAAALAQNAYADAWVKRSAQVEANLGVLQSLWRGLTDDAKGAWDAMLSIGRTASLDEKLAAARQSLLRAKAGVLFSSSVDDAQAAVAALEKQVEQERQRVAVKEQSNRAEKAGIEFLRDGEKYLTKQQMMEREIARSRELALAAGVSELELQKRIAQIREKYQEKKPAVKVNQPARDEGKAYIDFFDEMAKAEEAAVFSGMEFTKSQQALFKLMESPWWKDAPESLRAWVVEQYNGVRAQEQAVKVSADQAKWEKELAGYRQQEREAALQSAEALLNKAQAAEDENAQIGATADQMAELIRKRYDEQIAIKRARAEMLRDVEDREGEVYALEQQISALERLRDAEVARPKLQAQAQAWENFARDIEQSLTDALMRSFEAGDSFGEAFAKNLQNIFKTMVLKVVVQAVVGGTGSLFGLNMAGSGVSGLGNITNLASSWNGGGLFGNAADYAYTASGLRYGTGFMSGQSTQLAAQEWGLGSSGIPIGGMLSAYSIGGSRGFATGVGSTALAGGIGGMASGAGFASGAYGALASLGPYGWAAIGAAALLGMNQHGGTPHAGGIAFSSGDGYTTPRTAADISSHYASQSAADQMILSDWTRRNDPQTSIALGPAAEGFARTFNDIVTSNGRAGGYQFGLAFSADGEDPVRARSSILDAAGNQIAWTKDNNALGSDPQQGLQRMLTEQVPQLMLTALEGMDLNALANSYLDTLDIEHLSAEAAQQALNFVAATDEIITALGHLGIGADEVTTQLIKSLGGIDVAAAALDAYYQGFYSEARRGADATADVKAKFTALGLVMPLTTEGFVDLMDSLDLTTESGRATYAQLLQLSPQFLVVADAAQKAAQAWAGFDAAGLGQMMLDAAFNPAAGKSAADSFAETLDSSVRNALISSTVGNVATMIYNSIVVPMVAGAAVSQAAIDSVVQQAQAALTSLGTVLKNLDLSAITSATAALLPSIASYAPQRSVAQVAASEARQIADSQAQAASQIKREWQSVADAILGTMRELRGEILDDSRNFAAEQARFAIATAAARAGDQSAAQQLPDLARSVVDLGKAVTSTAAEQALLTARTLASLGQTVNLLDQQYGLDIPAFASGGYHAGGLRIVGEDGPELEATGPARIFSNGQLRDALQGGNLGDELRALRNEVSALRTENATLQRAIVTHTFNTAKTLQRITPDGDAMATRTAA